MTRQPAMRAICPAALPTAPAAPETKTVSPSFGSPEHEQPVPRGEARHAEDAERRRDRRDRRIEPAQRRAVRERPLAPAELVQHPLALGVARVARDGDPTDRAARHRLAERERRDVRADVVHARAHVRIDREVRVADEDLPLGRIRDRRLRDLEEVLAREALRPRDEPDLACDALHAAMIRPWSRCEGTSSSPARRSSTRTSGAPSCSSASTPRKARSASC